MHDDLTRAWPNRRGALGLALTALLCAFSPGLAGAGGFPVALEVVRPGREGLELTARLAEDGGLVTRNITWTIRHATGEPLFESEAGSVDISLAPGDYIINAEYGAAQVSRSVSIPPRSRLVVSFVLEAGGLSIHSRMGKTDFPALRPRVRVFALPGGRMVALEDTDGGITRLPAGRYRIESRAAAGNSVAVTDVEVRAGLVSTIAITHKAGLARLSFVGSPSAEVSWDIADETGRRVASESGLNTNIVLIPGTYTARAAVGTELLTARFRIAAGETRDIMLGN